MSWLIGLAVAATTIAPSAAVPLRHGLFVDHREHCGGGHGYLYSKFDGQSLTFGAPPVSVRLKRVSASEYVGEYQAQDGTSARDHFFIKRPTAFVWTGRGGTFHLKYCPNASLPREWRDPQGSN